MAQSGNCSEYKREDPSSVPKVGCGVTACDPSWRGGDSRITIWCSLVNQLSLLVCSRLKRECTSKPRYVVPGEQHLWLASALHTCAVPHECMLTCTHVHIQQASTEVHANGKTVGKPNQTKTTPLEKVPLIYLPREPGLHF